MSETDKKIKEQTITCPKVKVYHVLVPQLHYTTSIFLLNTWILKKKEKKRHQFWLFANSLTEYYYFFYVLEQ